MEYKEYLNRAFDGFNSANTYIQNHNPFPKGEWYNHPVAIVATVSMVAEIAFKAIPFCLTPKKGLRLKKATIKLVICSTIAGIITVAQNRLFKAAYQNNLKQNLLFTGAIIAASFIPHAIATCFERSRGNYQMQSDKSPDYESLIGLVKGALPRDATQENSAKGFFAILINDIINDAIAEGILHIVRGTLKFIEPKTDQNKPHPKTQKVQKLANKRIARNLAKLCEITGLQKNVTNNKVIHLIIHYWVFAGVLRNSLLEAI